MSHAPNSLNSEETAHAHRGHIHNKRFLRHFYEEMYEEFLRAARTVEALPGELLELGSGGGFLKERLPKVITSDVIALPFIDRVISAQHLPYPDEGLKAIFAMNVLHHLSDAELFFREAQRTLLPGGQLVLIEPHASLWGRLVYTHMHYEAFNDKAQDWKIPDSGRLTTANNALAWIIFERDRSRFDQLFPTLKVIRIRYHTVLRYLLSGGMSRFSFAPGFLFSIISAIDSVLSRAPRIFPMFQTIVIEKTA